MGTILEFRSKTAMTHFQKLELAINNFNDNEMLDDERFFIDRVMNGLIIIHDLMIFPNIENPKFQQYIGWLAGQSLCIKEIGEYKA